MNGGTKSKACLIISIFLLGIVCSAAAAQTIYVDADAIGANDGSSWADAYNYLQDALADANSVPKPVEIRVAEGIYTPDRNSADPNGSGDMEATFQLINVITLKGGYAGFGEPEPNTRDVELYETILSGDLDGNDVEVDPCDLLNEPNRAENSYHVVTGSGTDATAVLDGFTITGGNANDYYKGYYYHVGSGMYNYNGSPVIANCTFNENSAFAGGGMYNLYSNPILTDCTFSRNSGGGMHSFWGSRATLKNCMFRDNSSSYGGGLSDWVGSLLSNCTFIGNSARSSGGAISTDGSTLMDECTFIRNSAGYEGGAIYVIDNPTATFVDCVFEGNFAGHCGGGIYVFQGELELIGCTLHGNSSNQGGALAFNGSYSIVTDCTLRSNSASQSGGGVWGGGWLSMTNCSIENNSAEQGGGMSTYGKLTLMNCTFTGNSGRQGGGMYNNESSPILMNCTFNGNSALMGNAFACDSLDDWDPSEVELTECILWDGGNEIWNNDRSDIIITYSDVQEGWPGQGNIDDDPCFVEPGYWDPNGTPEDVNDDFWVDGDYHLLPDSPCINAGDPNYIPEPNETDLDGNPRVIGGRIDMGAYEYSPPIQAYVRIVPRTISLASSGKWIGAFLRLPEDYNVADIDPNSVLLENEIEPERFWLSEDNQIALIKFDREEVQAILNVGEIELTITGHLIDGQLFEGKDVIKVLNKRRRKVR
ncbi:MAG: right-handed parallel beta-helix repeat-containing protein [Planctomycetota bacterium]